MRRERSVHWFVVLGRDLVQHNVLLRLLAVDAAHCSDVAPHSSKVMVYPFLYLSISVSLQLQVVVIATCEYRRSLSSLHNKILG